MNVQWREMAGFKDVLYEKAAEGIAKITINRPKVRNAFRPLTVQEMCRAFADARDDVDIGVVILTGAGKEAFCAGGDQRVRGAGGYVGDDGVARLNVLDLQRQIRTLPKPVVAMVAGYAIGGGHILHLICDLTIAAENARFGQSGPKVGSFDGGYGSSYLVFVPPVRRAAGARDGVGQSRRPLRTARGGDHRLVPRNSAAQPDGAALPQVRSQRRL